MLAHPLTEADEGLQKMPHFHQMTRSVAAKQRSKVCSVALPQPEMPLSFKMDKLATIEGILSGMKTRIAGIEKTITAQLDKTKGYQAPEEGAAVQKADMPVAEGQASAAALPFEGTSSLSMPSQQ